MRGSPITRLQALDDTQGSSRKLVIDSGCVEHGCSGKRNDNRGDPLGNRRAQFGAKAFPDPAFQSVSHDSVAYSTRHGDSQPPLGLLSQPSRVEHEMFALSADALALEAQKLGAPMQPVGFAEAEWRAMPSYPGCFCGIEMLRRLRPLARRRFSTLRPPGVAMRAMNPWVRFRRRL